MEVDEPAAVAGGDASDPDWVSDGSFSGFGSEEQDQTPIRHRREYRGRRRGRGRLAARRGARRHREVSSGDSTGDEEEEEGGVARRLGGDRQRSRRRVRARRESGSARPVPSDGDEWTQDPTPPNLHRFTGIPGLNVPAPSTILGFLQLFITRELLEFLAAETNAYAHHMRNEVRRPDLMAWVPVTVRDIAVFLGLNVVMGLFPAPTRRMYWRRNKLYSMPNFAAVMSRHRFEAITRYFHSFNRKAIPRGNTDRLILVRTLMEYFQERFQRAYTPERNISLDEGLMPYKGRLSIKTYNPRSPASIASSSICCVKPRVGMFLTS